MAARRSNVTPKGRRRVNPFVMLEHRMLTTPAWQSLSGNAVKLLIELRRLYNGDNNGDLFLSERAAAVATGMAKGTASRALAELEDRGFIVATQRGHFKQKVRNATTWRLTFEATSTHAATHDYRDSTGKNHGINI